MPPTKAKPPYIHKGVNYSGRKQLSYRKYNSLPALQQHHYIHARQVRKAKRSAYTSLGIAGFYGAARLNKATGAVRLMSHATSFGEHHYVVVGSGKHGKGSYYTHGMGGGTLKGNWLPKNPRYPNAVYPDTNIRLHGVIRVPKFIAKFGPRDLRRVPGQLAVGPARMHKQPYIGKWNHTRRNLAIGGGIAVTGAALGGAAYALHRHRHPRPAAVHTHPRPAHRNMRVRRGAHGRFAGSY